MAARCSPSRMVGLFEINGLPPVQTVGRVPFTRSIQKKALLGLFSFLLAERLPLLLAHASGSSDATDHQLTTTSGKPRPNA